MLNFRQIEAFRAVMLSGSMTQAAKDLHTSQPNISRVIGQLERRISLKLFERHAGKLVPTLEGQVFFRDVEHTFAGLRGLEEAADTIRKRGSGRLRIASVPSMAIVVAPQAISLFARVYPDVDITLQVTDSLTVCQWLATGYVDVGIASEIFNSTSIEHEVLQRNVGVCITPLEHRLATRKRAVTPRDLAEEKFLSLKSSDVMRKQIDEACLIDGEEKRILAYESHFAAAICHMVSCGMGVSVSNPLVARNYAGRIAILPFSPRIEFPTYLVYPLNSPMNMLAKAFAKALRESVG
ncbi:MAG TPA: LysR substrate-binding domain-containing protein [Bordetella sp.]